MRPYQTFRFHEHPDAADLADDARKSSVGSLSEHDYIRSSKRKRQLRRQMKRRDRSRYKAEEYRAEA